MTYSNKETIAALNTLLADYHMHYQKLRNFHWNVTGSNFFELHEKFEELYEDAKLKIDEIAERILTLRAKPFSNYSSYLNNSNIKESESNLLDHEMVSAILEDHDIILSQLKNVAEKAADVKDEGTLDITGTYIGELEKTSWMLNAWNQRN
ncbi:DNA starvation/stationary phase protection protein [Aquimarina sp. AD10]|uniref:DNA starvation/stationary phase protection protein n=1 Tax=Aquimarina aggregata TaxID=1642818 RepID=A0A162FD35_9FLAO|nr:MULTISPECIES: DNA starvation/stationary phase protection protein [Aquimarina]AXT59097.1 DNA starvation/stationary phase protection protein [Aquimarina sp. AD10]KZS41476.1 DNA starvation/stationary phase protection protein [Aquimarina aggregata]RKM91581.1 DNA starvation/stationary phase protection protein [Aquimarina sp. AD10]